MRSSNLFCQNSIPSFSALLSLSTTNPFYSHTDDWKEREKKRLNEIETGWEHEREVRNEVSGCEGGSGEAYRQATASACVGEWEKWTSGHRHWKGKDVSTWEFGRSTSASVKTQKYCHDGALTAGQTITKNAVTLSGCWVFPVLFNGLSSLNF